MGCYVDYFCNRGWTRRLVAIAGFSIFCLFCIPRQTFSSERALEIASSAVDSASRGDTSKLVLDFEDFQQFLNDSDSPLEEARIFLTAFIEKINIRYGTCITLSQVCQVIREQEAVFDATPEVKDQFSLILEYLESSEMDEAGKFYWPWEWYQLYLKKETRKPVSQVSPFQIGVAEADAGVIVGGLEVIAGGTIAFVFGETIVGGIVGGAMIADGLSRIADSGQKDIDTALKERRALTDPYPDVGQ